MAPRLVRDGTVSLLLAEEAAAVGKWIQTVFGARTIGFRFLLLGLVSGALAGGATLVIGAFGFTGNPSAAIDHGLRYFAAPTVVLAWLSLAATHSVLGVVERGLPNVVGPCVVAANIVLAAALWLALMHVGTWLHWRQQFSPVGYASEWFYAEVFLFYSREPTGRVIVAATAMPIVLPPALYVLRVVASSARALWRLAHACASSGWR